MIDRKAVINWGDLLDRPDALDAQASDRSAVAGMARKSILLWTLDLKDRPASLRLNRVQPSGGDAVWVFSEQTVQNIDALHALYGPSRFEAWLPSILRQETVMGLMLWELLGLPLLLGLAIFAGWIVKRVLDALSRRAETGLVTDILKAIRGPAVFGTVVGLVSWASSTIFVFSGRIDAALSPLITLGIAAAALWLFVNAIDAVLDRLVNFGTDELTKQQEAEHRALATRVAAGRRALIVVVVIASVGIALSSTSIWQNLGLSLLGTAGALTLVLGFAARRVLGNIMSSLQIALNQSARIGDRIVYKDHLCHVERINFTFVQLREWDGTRLVVPVEEFVSEPFENWTMQVPEMLRIIKIRTSHDADVQKLREAFEELVQELDQDELGDMENLKVRVAGQDVFGMDVWFCLPCADPNSSWDVACQAREKLMVRANKIAKSEDITIFPEANPAEAA